jgi:hypothetical protein
MVWKLPDGFSEGEESTVWSMRYTEKVISCDAYYFEIQH